MKKLLSGILLLCMLLLNACAERQTAAPDPAAVPEETAVPEASERAEPEPAAESAAEPEKELPAPPDIDIGSWEFFYVSPNVSFGRYQPKVRNLENQYFDARCADAAADFLAAARQAGYTVYINCAYRNFEYTMFWYEKEIEKYGSSYEAAQHGFAPGCSEHSIGLAFDITDEPRFAANYNNMHDETVADTEVYKWMADHCAEYGFIVRYPKGKEEYYIRSCYPGHFRYVGVEAAQYIMENGLCLEEFLALYK